MIALDTNILIYAHREDVAQHKRAYEAVVELAVRGEPWAIPWPCIHEFIGQLTRPGYFNPPTPLRLALDAVAVLIESPDLVLLGEGPSHYERLRDTSLRAGCAGAMIRDARIVAICLAHGVRELWSADRDFSRFPDLKVVNPLVA